VLLPSCPELSHATGTLDLERLLPTEPCQGRISPLVPEPCLKQLLHFPSTPDVLTHLLLLPIQLELHLQDVALLPDGISSVHFQHPLPIAAIPGTLSTHPRNCRWGAWMRGSRPLAHGQVRSSAVAVPRADHPPIERTVFPGVCRSLRKPCVAPDSPVLYEERMHISDFIADPMGHYMMGFLWGCVVGWYCCWSNLRHRFSASAASADHPADTHPWSVAQQVRRHTRRRSAEPEEHSSTLLAAAPYSLPPTGWRGSSAPDAT
jgi:hypothetical protein